MTDQLLEEPESRQRRPAWRQRLVDAEGGFRDGMRADSTLYAFFFCAAGVFLTSLVLGLTRVEWAIMILALGFSLSAELLHQVLKMVEADSDLDQNGAFRLGTSAVVVAHLTAAIVAGFLLSPHFSSLWGQ